MDQESSDEVFEEIFDYIIDNTVTKMALNFKDKRSVLYWLEYSNTYEYQTVNGTVSIKQIIETLENNFGSQLPANGHDTNLNYEMNATNSVHVINAMALSNANKIKTAEPVLPICHVKSGRKPKKQNAVEITVFRCQDCLEVFDSKNSLNQHRRKHRPKIEMHCPICPKVYCNKAAYTKHVKTHQENPEEEPQTKSPSAKRPRPKRAKLSQPTTNDESASQEETVDQQQPMLQPVSSTFINHQITPCY